jgi:hypothetical protein
VTDLAFFDINAAFGASQVGTFRPAADRAGLLTAMDEAGIAEALAWHIGQQEWSAPEANARLADLVADEPRLHGCWAILPPGTGELPEPVTFFAGMRERRISALRAFPGDHHWILCHESLGALLAGIVERRIPLLLSLRRGGVTWPIVYEFLREAPKLVCVLCDLGDWGCDRFYRPLLDRCPGVHVETSVLALHDAVIEDVVRAHGAERLVFGTGFPDRLPASAMLPLARADISDSAKQAIASGNARRLLAEAKP